MQSKERMGNVSDINGTATVWSRRRILSGATLAAGSAVLAACGAPGAQQDAPKAVAKLDRPVEVSFWHPQSSSNGKALQDLVDKFNATNDKKITVKAEYAGSYTQLHEKNQVALQAGTPVDLTVAYENWVAEYMRGNHVIDLDEYVKDKGVGLSKESLDDIFPTYLEGLRFQQYGNKLLSFPFTKSLVVMYVNEEVLTRASVRSIPRTWDEFATAIQQTSRTDSSMIVDPSLGAVQDQARARTYGWGNYPSASTINAWAYSRGGTMMSADNKQVRFAEAPFLESFQLTEEAFKRQQAYNPPRQPGSDFDFVSNRMAFIMQSSTTRPFIRRVMQDNGRDKMPWKVALIPQKDPAKPATVQYGANIAILRTMPEKHTAAWEFVKWFTDRNQDVQWSLTSSYMPIRRSSAEHPDLKAHWEKTDPQGKQAFEISKFAKPEPNIRGTEPIRPVIQKALQDVMEGKKSSKAALEEAAREANQLLAQA
jgi:multiple sugar transport system substrate-binding protein